MRSIIVCVIVLFAIYATPTLCDDNTPNLWPVPSSIKLGDGKLTISEPCDFRYQFHTDIPAKHRHHYRTALHKLHSKHIRKNCRQELSADADSHITWTKPLVETEKIGSNVLHITVEDTSSIPLIIGTTNESYILTITAQSQLITAPNFVAMARALSTLSQLNSNNNGSAQINNVPLTINDQPRYPYRGVMLDTSRHFLSVDAIMQTLDGLAMNKLNAFHWHISDSDAFPMYMPSHPNMTNSAYSPNQIYSYDDVNSIVQYAQSLGIAIIPELDAPSHVGSWHVASEWSSNIVCANFSGPGDIPLGMLDVTLDSTYKLLGQLYNDLQRGYFKDFGMMHLGADEVAQSCIDQIPNIKQFMAANNLNSTMDVFNYYVNRSKSLVDSNITRIYWSNLDTLYLKFEQQDIIQWWGNTTGLSSYFATYPKNRIIISNYDFYYMDCGMGDYFGYQAWCTYSPWGSIYGFDAETIINNETRSNNIFGGEIGLWAEMVNDYVLPGKLWPRGIAFAEKMWSPKNIANNSQLAVFKRLNTQVTRMLDAEIGSAPASASWCEHHPEGCFSSVNSFNPLLAEVGLELPPQPQPKSTPEQKKVLSVKIHKKTKAAEV